MSTRLKGTRTKDNVLGDRNILYLQTVNTESHVEEEESTPGP